jgi:arsenate reductase-like glutaredoxin family protein
MNKKEFIQKWTFNHPTNTGKPEFSVEEVIEIIEQWENHVEKTFPTENEITKEANKQKDLDTRVAFRNGAKYMLIAKRRRK